MCCASDASAGPAARRPNKARATVGAREVFGTCAGPDLRTKPPISLPNDALAVIRLGKVLSDWIFETPTVARIGQEIMERNSIKVGTR